MDLTQIDKFKKLIESLSLSFQKIENNFDTYLSLQSEFLNNTNYSQFLSTEIPDDDQDRLIKIQIDALNNSIVYINNYAENLFTTQLGATRFNKITELFIFSYEVIKASNANIEYINTLVHDLIKQFENKTNQQIAGRIKRLLEIKSSLLFDLTKINENQSKIHVEIELAFTKDSEFSERVNEEITLLRKEYENKIFSSTERFDNKIKNFELDLDKIIKSNDLLSTSVDTSLKNLGKLSEQIQGIELKFSKIIGTETEKVKTDLNASRIVLMNVIDSITTEANTKLNEITNAHSDFINLVSNAGIYNLTENYKTKADEEKTEYTTYRKHTTQAIIAAIVSTLVIFIIAFLEHLFSTTKTDTNFLLLASRLSISVMFFVLAFYLSKQAAKHYECYQENHRTFLQLAALEPFMARMSEEEQKEIRKGLIPSYFNQSADGKFAAKGDEVDMSMMFTFMDKLSNFAQIKKEQKPAETPATETKP